MSDENKPKKETNKATTKENKEKVEQIQPTEEPQPAPEVKTKDTEQEQKEEGSPTEESKEEIVKEPAEETKEEQNVPEHAKDEEEPKGAEEDKKETEEKDKIEKTEEPVESEKQEEKSDEKPEPKTEIREEKPKEEFKPKKEIKDIEKKDDDFQYIVRIANTDIDGNKKVINGISQIRGIGQHMSVLIADAANVDRQLKIGNLTESQIDKIKEALENLEKAVPSWMLNRRKDYDTGKDIHLISSEVDMRLRDDVNLLKMIRSYRGIRHETGLAVRGQRTRANARRGLAMGVSKKSQQQKK